MPTATKKTAATKSAKTTTPKGKSATTAKDARNGNGGSSFEQTFKNLDDVLWKEAGCSSELDYTEQSSWILFLKYLDDLEAEKAMQAELTGKKYEYLLDKKYRWSTWAAPRLDSARRPQKILAP